jgi:cysteine synthase
MPFHVIGDGWDDCGIGTYLKKKRPSIQIVLVDPPGGALYHKIEQGTYWATRWEIRTHTLKETILKVLTNLIVPFMRVVAPYVRVVTWSNACLTNKSNVHRSGIECYTHSTNMFTVQD